MTLPEISDFITAEFTESLVETAKIPIMISCKIVLVNGEYSLAVKLTVFSPTAPAALTPSPTKPAR